MITASAGAAPLRTAVIGVGYLGRYHAQKYAKLPDVDLVAVIDSDAARAHAVAAELFTIAATDYRELEGAVDAVSIAVPTPLHHAIGRELLGQGVHVLMEKPIALTADEARDLIAVADGNGCVLQVGHLERFNPAVVAAAKRIRAPRFIESHRLAPFSSRGTDISVVLDLLIHDIDLIHELVDSPVDSIDATGATVFSGETDIVNARIHFANGCVANTTASRVSLKRERKIRIFQDDAYLSIDMGKGKLMVVGRKGGDDRPLKSPAQLDVEERDFPDADALLAEIEAFLHAVRHGTLPLVSGSDGLRALEIATLVSEAVQRPQRIAVT